MPIEGTKPILTFARLLRFSCFALLVAGLLALGGDLSWWMDLFTHFRVHIAALSVVMFVLALWISSNLSAGAVLIAGAISAFPMLYVQSTSVPASDDVPFTVLSWNVFHLNQTTAPALDEIRRLDPDVLILSETSPHWRDALLILDELYPYQHHADRCDDVGCQVSLMSKHPWLSVQSEKFVFDTPPVIWASFAGINDSPPFHVFAVHMRKATSADGGWRQRNQASALGEVVRKTPGPIIMAGDMNATPTSAAFRRLLSETELTGSDISFEATWPSFLGPFGLAIDHFFVNDNISVGVERLGYWGSDHRMTLGRVTFDSD